DSCEVSFRIKDTEDPKADCSKMEDYDVFITSTACDTTFLLHEPEGVFTDNCGIDHYGFTWKFQDGEMSEGKAYNAENATLTFKPGKYTITWWAEDKEGLKSENCTQTITVRDSSIFKVTCPNDESDKVYDVQICENPTGDLLLDSLTQAVYKPTATFTKNCDDVVYPTIEETVYIRDAESTEWTLMKEVTSLELKKEYVVRWKFSVEATDQVAAMADSSCEYNVRIGDVTIPEFTCPTLGEANTEITSTDCMAKMDINLGDLAPTDNCESDPADFTYGYYIKDYSEDTTYVAYTTSPIKVEMRVSPDPYTVVWVVADKAGNRAECEQVVKANDITKPVITCPADTAIKVTTACDTTMTISAPEVSDNCTGDITFTYQIGEATAEAYTAPFDYTFPLGETTITWIAKDSTGNESEPCVRNYEVTDKTGFNFYCPDMKDVVIDTCVVINWATLEKMIPEDQTPLATYLNCAENIKDTLAPTITYKVDGGDATAISSDLEFEYGKTYILTYNFKKEGENIETFEQECTINVTVKDTAAPIFDCTKVAGEITLDVVNGCDTTYELIAPAAAVSDTCTKDSADFKFFYSIDGGTKKAFETASSEVFQVGKNYTITWSVKDEHDNDARTTCDQTVTVNDKRKINLTCPSEDDITFNWCDTGDDYQWKNTEFSIKDTLLNQSSHWPSASATKCANGTETTETVALDSTIYLFDGTAWSEMTDETKFSYDTEYKIKWVYAKSGEYLAEVKDSCEVSFRIKDTEDPKADCSKMENYDIYIATAACDTTFKLHEPAGVFYDNCGIDHYGFMLKFSNDSTSEALVYNDETAQVSWRPGTYTITWWAEDKEGQKSPECNQVVTVYDTVPPAVDCSVFEDVSIIWTELGDVVPFENVVEAGLVIDPSIKGDCDGDIFGIPSRSDNVAFESPFMVDTMTIVTWTFTDSSKNSSTCTQNIYIQNLMDIPIECPTLEKDLYNCVEDIPAPYANWEEFTAAGGSALAEKYLKLSTFGVEETRTGQCTVEVKRTYYVYDLKNHRSECEQIFTVVDTIAPVITSTVENLVLGCKDDIPEAPVVYATDACQTTQIIADLHEVNDRSTDTHSCGYYNYTITRTWTATDSCGNTSEPLVQYISVVDTIDPHFNFPDDWRDTVLAVAIKGCEFQIPDFSSKVRSIIEDNCTETEDLIIQQVPAAGTSIDDSKFVKVYVSDFCGNKDSLEIYVMMSTPKAIVTLNANSLTTCVSDSTAISLWSQNVREAHGRMYVYDWDGTITTIPSTFTYDCYKENISDTTLVFSDNFVTNGSKFYSTDREFYNRQRDSLINLTRRAQSGLYYFVAMDTLTLCSDTASAYLDFRERPRISMNSGDFSVCEFDSLPLDQIMSEFSVCLDDMGYPITDEGWMIDGHKYTSTDSVLTVSDRLSLYYYAENECGSTSSLDSYFGACFRYPVGADSVEVFGSEMNVKLFREDRLVVSSSITLDVHHRFDEKSMMLVADPSDPATIFIGDNATLSLHTNQKPSNIDWYRVVDHFDARFGNKYDLNGELLDADSLGLEVNDELIDRTDSTESRFMEQILYNLTDSATYYVVVSDFVCPSMASNVVQINVNDFVPTAITPYDKDGLNDVFMPNCPVIIFNRYGQKIHEGWGWDGSDAGRIADPGVYFYELTFPSGATRKGTIEVVKF
ncbi:MAG: gliding motility-associated C-terminal domain-containing protein, partial [Paludibacteraceae bacterium]|nr:gliding motility-associated C-terminal domain-containing protein [Paludibacteraceae bacterium]